MNKLLEEQVVLVSENDEMVGTIDKLTAHREGLLHRAFSVFIFRENNGVIEFLLQQRSSQKYHSAGLWTNSCCSHPRLNEDIISAGERRLKEELSLSLPLLSAGSFQYRAPLENGLTEHELDHVLLGKYQDETICFDPTEVQDIQWVSFNQLEENLRNTPHLYTAWLKPALEIAWGELCCLKY